MVECLPSIRKAPGSTSALHKPDSIRPHTLVPGRRKQENLKYGVQVQPGLYAIWPQNKLNKYVSKSQETDGFSNPFVKSYLCEVSLPQVEEHLTGNTTGAKRSYVSHKDHDHGRANSGELNHRLGGLRTTEKEGWKEA